jgi:hypothetical protein
MIYYRHKARGISWIGSLCRLSIGLLFTFPFYVSAKIGENEFNFGFASGFGIKANFQNPAMPIPTYPGTPSREAGKTIYHYLDGYVDGAGTTGNKWVEEFLRPDGHLIQTTYYGTWDWKYDDADQYLGNGVIRFMDEQSTIDESTFQKGRPGFVPGIHFGYRREVRADDHISLGFIAGLEYHRIDISSNAQFEANYYQATDYYKLADPSSLPSAPYIGAPGGPEIANLYDPSKRSILEGVTTTYRDNTFEANLFVLQTGMDFRYTFEDNMSIQVGIGIIYAPIFYDYSFRDTLQLASNSPETIFGSGSKSDFDWIFGSFIQVKWEFQFKENMRGYIGIRHMHMDKVKFEYEEDRSTELNFRNSVFLDTGITYLW